MKETEISVSVEGETGGMKFVIVTVKAGSVRIRVGMSGLEACSLAEMMAIAAEETVK